MLRGHSTEWKRHRILFVTLIPRQNATLVKRGLSFRKNLKSILVALIPVIVLLTYSATSVGAEKTKILFVTTSVDRVNDSPNGTYLIELAVPFDYLTKAGYQIDIVSPKGSAIPVYHKGEYGGVLQRIIKSDFFVQAISNTLTPDKVVVQDYVAVIIPGGYGQFWDIHEDERIGNIITSIYEQSGVIGTLGHGASTLVGLKTRDGEYLVKGKTLTCFPTRNEKLFMQESDFGRLLPFDMEKELKAQGADLLVYDSDKKANYEIVDKKHRIVTAAFASGGEFVANQVHQLIQSQRTRRFETLID